MADGVIQSAIHNLENKYVPQVSAPNVFIPAEAYRTLFDVLEIWGRDTENQDTQERVKYIYDKLLEGGNPKKSLLDLINSMGVIPVGDTKLNRVWKCLHLNEDAQRARKHYNILLGEIKNLQGEKDARRK